ncbi:LytTR family transcriptional regulator DNA-binding domain-containing protein [Solitalea sp. MAHUQ-68]|uniref:LytTR family transcriptional regulator DNA-binding domain-containing protein n=1 Tax=Solitalea agri TaxID=2953739 RepID=A0A9X2F403_9SPHI|nr:LytTR family transcriptional regulator DNA-binding domain-containing protein [Solitalea agri]MCO4293765.1 LytTR family transcriptional regulator DNA-binding domain-containing protein [Solitalea agri]
MIKTILIDDEPLARAIVKEYLKDYPEIEIVQECGDGFEGVKAIGTHKPNLIFLDIQMPKITGFEMLELLDCPPSIIFTTAFDEYAIRAFEANAIDYLLKPFSKERFDKAIQKWLANRNTNEVPTTTKQAIENVAASSTQNNRVVVKVEGKIKIIPVSEIHYLEASDDYVKIQTEEGSFLKNKTMSFFEKTLDEQLFIRIHRSYIINLNQIVRIDIYDKESHLAVLKSGIQIPVSKSGYTKLKEVLNI